MAIIEADDQYPGTALRFPGNVNRADLMHNLRVEALKYFFWVIDLRPGTEPTEREIQLFGICLPYINVVFDEYGDRDLVIKYSPDNKLLTVSRDTAKDNLPTASGSANSF